MERLAWGGLGLARDGDGRLVLLRAPLALFPGEEVEAEVQWKSRHGEGTVLSWHSRDPGRADPGCPVAERCGGCDLWGAGTHLAELKRAMVEDLLHRSLPSAPAWTYVPAPEEARRHRIQVHWDGQRLGFHARRSHQVVSVHACPAAADPLSRALPLLADALARRTLPQRPQRWELATGTPAGEVWAINERQSCWQLREGDWGEADPDLGLAHVHGPHTLRHRPGGFFQVAAPWAMEAFRTQMEAWDLRGDQLFDLYGGVGLFSLLLGDRFRHRVLVESDAPAVAWATRNLEAAGLSATCKAEDVDTWLPEHLGQPEDLLILDPPRAGLSPGICTRLQSSGAGRLLLLGCDGAAFCRDIQRLAPRWKLQRLTVLDLFPLTPHVECMGLLS